MIVDVFRALVLSSNEDKVEIESYILVLFMNSLSKTRKEKQQRNLHRKKLFQDLVPLPQVFTTRLCSKATEYVS